jgi:hypothetical protein
MSAAAMQTCGWCARNLKVTSTAKQRPAAFVIARQGDRGMPQKYGACALHLAMAVRYVTVPGRRATVERLS